jgi:hypothetical protein
MTVALLLVAAAAIALLVILRITFSGSLQVSRGAEAEQLQPIDLEAFRNLVDPAEGEYLRQELPSPEFRRVQRRRLLATAHYVKATARNAALLVRIGQSAVGSSDASMEQAGRQLVENALLLRRNAAFALLRIYVAIPWPNPRLTASPLLRDYEQLSGAAMLLGRLQNPARPVRISAAR